MQHTHPIPTVGALVQGPSGRVLIVKTTKWQGLWGVPGGKIEWGEPLEKALRREFREEVGLELFNIRHALLLEGVFDPEFHKPMHFLFVNYFALSSSEEVQPNEEIVEWAWVRPEEALQYPLNRITRALLEAYMRQGAA
ncbi:MAG: NUDIX domain-containing protein [Meiothermus sp.]|uniref:NUDIX domain-containing protein n=1 Tax=Meiothermus sp. TaxID=1955249 RepID=UPI0028CF10F0|nr:NUDIX domain-containing protein [Meiothermus sp.]MDT7919928.1 NUDIX domain-containing protein [Meiothermus sp.]